MSTQENTEQIREVIPQKQAGSGRLILTLGAAGFFSGLVLASVFLFTRPMIQANQAEDLQEAIYKVLPGCERFEAFKMEEGVLVEASGDSLSAGNEELRLIYAGYDAGEQLIGFAIESSEPGYQDVIKGIFGYDPYQKRITGFEVLESKETPGLGEKIRKDESFLQNLRSLAIEPEIKLVKSGEKQSDNEVEAITGATISSRAVTNLLKSGLEEWRKAIDEYVEKR